MDDRTPDSRALSAPRRLEALAEGQRQVVELMAKDAPLGAVLGCLCHLLETQLPQALCSVLLLETDGARIRVGAGPSLPEEYLKAIDNHPTGPAAGSCGTAIFRRETVVAEDIATDPLWEDYREPALRHGLSACASTPIFDGAGRVLGSFAIYHRAAGPFDADELELLRNMDSLAALAIAQHHQMNALRDQVERLAMAQRLAHLGFWTWLVGEDRVEWSDGLYGIYGLDRATFGASFAGYLACVHPEDRDRVQALIRQALEAKEPFAFEERIVRPGGETRWLRSWGTVVVDGQGRPERMMGTCLDITEQRASEEALRQAQKLEGLAVLAGGIAHDFNNLLTAILGNLELAVAATPPSSVSRGHLERMGQAVARASDLARQMLAYSGKGRVVVRAVDLNSLIAELAQLLKASLPKKAELELELPPGLPPVEGDASQLQQVVMNLVINAAESLPEGAGRITVRTLRRDQEPLDPALIFPGGTPRPGAYVRLEVADTGSGMPPEVRSRIFDPFFTTKPTGRGLGLSAMMGILRGHHAGIAVESEPGRGTRFSLLLPASERPADPPAPLRERPFPQGGLALVVDDEAEIRETATAMLELLGFECLRAGDGAEAIKLVRARGAELRLVLLDLSMPKVDGREAFHAIRALRPGLKVILTSGFDLQESARDIVGQGLAGFLQKPYRLEDLRHAVLTALPD